MSLEQVIFKFFFLFCHQWSRPKSKGCPNKITNRVHFLFYIKTSTNAPKIQTTVTIRPLVPIPEDLMSALVNKDIVEMASTVQVC